MPGGRPPKFKSVEELQIKIDAYFDMCDENNRPYTMSGLANSLDCDRDTVLNYSKKEEYFGTIKKAKRRVEEYVECRLFQGKATGPIFNLKNNFGWKDKKEIEHNHNGVIEFLHDLKGNKRD